jgi:hypothetical protein
MMILKKASGISNPLAKRSNLSFKTGPVITVTFSSPAPHD